MKITKKHLIYIILIATYTILFLGMNLSIIKTHNSKKSTTNNVNTIDKVNITHNHSTKQYTLPYKFTNLKNRSKITVEFKLKDQLGSFLYLKTVYAPVDVYANNKLIYTYGSNETRPLFMKDPATKAKVLELPKQLKNPKIKIIYHSPIDRNSLMIHPYLNGSHSSIQKNLFSEMGFIFFLDIINVLLGILLLIIGIVSFSIDTISMSFIWIGTFSLITGLFSLGECNLTQLFINNENLLYVFDFCCFFILPIPLIEFVISLIDFKYIKTLRIFELIQGIVASLALFLQVFSIKPLFWSLYIFIILSPITLLYLVSMIIYEYKNNNSQAQPFILPIFIVAISAIIEAINYKYRFIATLSSCFLIGVLIFTIILSIQCGINLRNILLIKHKNDNLELEISLLEHQINAQEQRNEMVLENAEIIKNQRHDLRHQLAVIRQYNKEGKKDAITEYIDTLITNIPTEKSMTFCENDAVNALLLYYISIAKLHNIDLTTDLLIPKSLKHIKNNDLCIIVGNLIENAIEACKRMPENNYRYIKINSNMHYDTLTITMDNSFDGTFTLINDVFISSKRNEPGLGIGSIKKVTEKYNGSSRFESQNQVFMSSVYIKDAE